MPRSVTTAAACLMMAAGLALAATPADVIAARKAGYKHIGEINKGMKQAVEGGEDVTRFSGPAGEVADWGRKLVTLFPPGTESGHETKARPEIWSERPEFEARAAALVAEAEKLSRVAATGDQDSFATQWKALTDTCAACHKQFKYKG